MGRIQTPFVVALAAAVTACSISPEGEGRPALEKKYGLIQLNPGDLVPFMLAPDHPMQLSLISPTYGDDAELAKVFDTAVSGLRLTRVRDSVEMPINVDRSNATFDCPSRPGQANVPTMGVSPASSLPSGWYELKLGSGLMSLVDVDSYVKVDTAGAPAVRFGINTDPTLRRVRRCVGSDNSTRIDVLFSESVGIGVPGDLSSSISITDASGDEVVCSEAGGFEGSPLVTNGDRLDTWSLACPVIPETMKLTVGSSVTTADGRSVKNIQTGAGVSVTIDWSTAPVEFGCPSFVP